VSLHVPDDCSTLPVLDVRLFVFITCIQSTLYQEERFLEISYSGGYGDVTRTE
jgi:hypothetical protein